MNRFLTIVLASGAVALGAPAMAEDAAPPPAPKPLVAQKDERPTQLASATEVAMRVEGEGDADVPKRKRSARVTTCRCGDVAPPK